MRRARRLSVQRGGCRLACMRQRPGCVKVVPTSQNVSASTFDRAWTSASAALQTVAACPPGSSDIRPFCRALHVLDQNRHVRRRTLVAEQPTLAQPVPLALAPDL